MIDLRSDTVTIPNRTMLETILTASMEDDGRRAEDGSGGDETVKKLEQLAASLMGKEEAVLFPTGTMANTAALLSVCSPKDKVLVDEIMHMYATEKTAFDPCFGQLIPCFYRLTKDGLPDLNDLKRAISENSPKLVCVENTHNFSGGTCLPPALLGEIAEIAHGLGIPVHMDGARLFNAACALGVKASELAAPVDTVMFCLSKGLGAPIGSLLCGNADRMKLCRVLRKKLGGNMRQSGIIAAPGLWALEHNIDRLAEDHKNAKLFAQILPSLTEKIKIGHPVVSNIVLLDITDTGLTFKEFLTGITKRGVGAHLVPGYIRLVFNLNVNSENTLMAARIIADYANENAGN